MAMKARYTVIDGEVIAEKRNGVRSLYVPDPLGSTVGLIDSGQTQTDTFGYWPYGENNMRTGTMPTPFQFVGTAGYHRDSASRTYVRARTLNTLKALWVTRDPITVRTGRASYVYSLNAPSTATDPSGLLPSYAGLPVGFPFPLPSECCGPDGKPLSCATICDNYKLRPDAYLNDIAGVVCCGPIKCTCIFGPPDLPEYPGTGVCPEIDACINQHERQHFGDVKCDPSLGLNRPPFIHPDQQNNRECDLRFQSMMCLNRLHLSGKCGTLLFILREMTITFLKYSCTF